jgi:hypothetical protein
MYLGSSNERREMLNKDLPTWDRSIDVRCPLGTRLAAEFQIATCATLVVRIVLDVRK